MRLGAPLGLIRAGALLFLVFSLTGATQNFNSGRSKPSSPEPVVEEEPPSPPAVEAPIPLEQPADPHNETSFDLPSEPKPETPAHPAQEEPAALPQPVPIPAPAAPPEPLPLLPGPGTVETSPVSSASPESVAPPVLPETVWVEDALPSLSSEDGTWIWDTANPGSGTAAHGHPAGEGIQWHGYRLAKPVPLPANGMITQKVWLDPQDPPKGIALKLVLAGGEEVGVYWEGEEEVFKPKESEELWYYGPLPEYGKWVTLEILAEDLGLEEGQVAGVRFVTFDGKALWDRTALKEAPPLDETPVVPEGPTDMRPSFSAGSGS